MLKLISQPDTKNITGAQIAYNKQTNIYVYDAEGYSEVTDIPEGYMQTRT